MKRILSLLLAGFLLLGCSKPPSGPPSVHETSVERSALADRVAFVEQYVTFRRSYEQLDYDIMYQNNGGGMVPGPSDWEIRLIAVVPADEIDDWVPDGSMKKVDTSSEWLSDLPGMIERGAISEWYHHGGTVVGIDRENSVVAFRSTSTPG